MIPIPKDILRSAFLRLLLERTSPAEPTTPSAVPDLRDLHSLERYVESRKVKDRRGNRQPIYNGRRASDAYPEGGAPRDARDRRKESRYIPVARRAFLGWWEAEAFEAVPARIENLSRSGAALLVDEFPDPTKTVCLALASQVRQEWYSANVVSVAPAGGVGKVVRIALVQPLPYEVYSAVVWGFPSDQIPTITT